MQNRLCESQMGVIMDNISLEQIKQLGLQPVDPGVSMYLPTHRAGQDKGQDPIRLKNLLQEAEKKLREDGCGGDQVRKILEPARSLLADPSFWINTDLGLALYASADNFHVFRLPFSVKQQMVIAGSFYIKPVLPLFINDGRYYILAVSQDEVRLFEGTRHTVRQIDLPEDAPKNKDEALNLDEPEKQLQFHTRTTQGGERTAMFHGHGGGEEDQKTYTEQYLNQVDAAIRATLGNQGPPLVLAGVENTLAMYQKVSEYKNILPEGISGSPEELSGEDLQAQAWPMVEPLFRQEIAETIDQYRQLIRAGKATEIIEEIVPAAYYGRVDKLILPVNKEVWGSFNPETGQVGANLEGQSHLRDIALLDFAALYTIENNGTVYVLPPEELPEDILIAAVLRY